MCSMFTFNRRKTSNTDQRTEYGKQKNRNVKAMNRHSFIMQQKTSTYFNILQHTSTSRFQLATLNCAAGSREINTQKINLKLPAPLRFQQRYSRTTAYNVALKVFSRLNAMLACISLNFTLTSLGTQHRLSRRKRAKKMKVLH